MYLIPFSADATPRVGTPLAYQPMSGVTNPLLARGVVLTGAFEPIVLVSIDWLGIAGSGHAHMRAALAEAAGTTPDRVALHTVHQHDAPRVDLETRNRMQALDLPCHYLGLDAADSLVADLRRSMEMSREQPIPVTHVGCGSAEVRQVASTRRVMGEDGKVMYIRLSSCRNEAARAAPEGRIDPRLRLLSFWNQEEAVMGLSYYACHPQSYYQTGFADADFPAIARQRADVETGVPHIYFTGAAGNVAAGKWNDGSRAARTRLVDRMTTAYHEAWKATERFAIRDEDIGWRSLSVELPPADHVLDRPALEAVSSDPERPMQERIFAIRNLALGDDLKRSKLETLSCLQLGPAQVVHGPGELFVEYQLFAQSLCPEQCVAMAAYGDLRYSYIGTATTRVEGGYEALEGVRRVADGAEPVLQKALRSLLRQPSRAITA